MHCIPRNAQRSHSKPIRIGIQCCSLHSIYRGCPLLCFLAFIYLLTSSCEESAYGCTLWQALITLQVSTCTVVQMHGAEGGAQDEQLT